MADQPKDDSKENAALTTKKPVPESPPQEKVCQNQTESRPFIASHPAVAKHMMERWYGKQDK